MNKKMILTLLILSLCNSFSYAEIVNQNIGEQKQEQEQLGETKGNNTLQKDYEDKKYDTNINIDSYYMIEEDYNIFMSDKDDSESSILGIINYKIKNPKIKKEEKVYYQQIMDNLIDAVELKSIAKPILVDDNIYKNFSVDLKEMLAMYNNLFCDKPIDLFSYADEQYNLDNLEEEELKEIPEPQLTKAEKFNYGLEKVIGMPSTSLENLAQGKFKKFWVDKKLEAEYASKLQERKLEAENKRENIKKKNREVINVLYLRGFEEKARNTAILATSQKISYNNKRYSGDELLEEIKNTDNQVEKLYKGYKNNPNNMKQNYELVKLMGMSKGKYTYFIKTIESDVINKAYEVYTDSYNSQKTRNNIKFDNDLFNNPEDAVGFLDKSTFSLRLFDKNSMVKAHDEMIDLISKYDTYAKEVSTYSYKYEQKKYNEWAIRNGKKQIKGSLEGFVYNSYNTPVKNSLYTHDPINNLFLKVLQTVPGGVIISGTYIGGGISGVNLIYLQTTKPYADGQYIKEPIIAEFKGYYDYTTVLGARKRIYKFYRYGTNEIKSNFVIPGQPLYFYSNY